MPLFNPLVNTIIQMQTTANASPADGNVWYDSTQKALMVSLDGITQNMSTVLFTGTATKTIVNTGTETSSIPTGVGTLTIPANFLVAGKTLRLSGGGIFSTLLTPGNLTIKMKLGATVIASNVVSNLLASASNNAFQFSATITCRTTGATGTILVDGNASYDTGTLSRGFAALNNTGSATSIDTTASQLIDVTLQWTTASTSNTISTTNARVEVLN